MNRALIDYYMCPEHLVNFQLEGELSADLGFFCFGQDIICYGRSASGFRSRLASDVLYDAAQDVRFDGQACRLSFDPTQVIENLRYERHAVDFHRDSRSLAGGHFLKNAYYFLRPAIPAFLRRQFQKMHFSDWNHIAFPAWPVDRTVENMLAKLLALNIKAQGVEKMPFIWFWPNGLPSCAIVTHDIEFTVGRDFCSTLMDMDDSFAIPASFQVVPEKRYKVSQGFLDSIRNRGFEINVHDLNHDGHLYRNRGEFLRRAEIINQYARKFGASGFRSGAMYRHADWYDALDISYDMSISNTAHFDPQRGGCCTVMPYFVGRILELPLTTTQDYSLFHILGDYSIDLWKKQIELIQDKYGLISFSFHPDYLIPERARNVYRVLLQYLSELRAAGKIWLAMPKEVDSWWRERSRMKVVFDGGKWRIEGKGKERARLAYASLNDGRITYTLDPSS